MSIELNHDPEKKVLAVTLTGKLEKSDYAAFEPMVEGIIRRDGKVNLLVTLHDFHGWTAGALWEDVKFDAKHFRDFEKLAIVGETKWEQGMATFCKPFTTASIRYFPVEQAAEARKWIGIDG